MNAIAEDSVFDEFELRREGLVIDVVGYGDRKLGVCLVAFQLTEMTVGLLFSDFLKLYRESDCSIAIRRLDFLLPLRACLTRISNRKKVRFRQ